MASPLPEIGGILTGRRLSLRFGRIPVDSGRRSAITVCGWKSCRERPRRPRPRRARRSIATPAGGHSPAGRDSPHRPARSTAHRHHGPRPGL